MLVSRQIHRLGLSSLCLGALLALACDRKQQVKEENKTSFVATAQSDEAKPKTAPEAPDQASARKARELALTLPPKEKIEGVVNPQGAPPFNGPVGGVRGVVTISGDAPPNLPEVLAKMEPSCIAARSMYGKLFREGEGRTLADAFVAVTEYEGYVPIEDTDVRVEAKGCTFGTRTLAMTYGQRLVIHGMDNRPYVPEILGQPLPAQLFLLPTAPTVSIAPRMPGQFKLIDSMRLFNAVELLIVPYTTFDVTKLDGKFEVQGVPAGPVKINALLPQAKLVAGKEVTIVAGQTVELNLELHFDRATWEKEPKPVPLDERPAPVFKQPDPKAE